MGRDETGNMACRALRRSKLIVCRPNLAQLDVTELPPVRQERQVRTAEPVMALPALCLIDMTPLARLTVVQRLYRMKFTPVAPMTLRRVIPAIILARKARINATAMVAVKTVGLIMALGAVMSTPACQEAMIPYPVGRVVGRDPFPLVARIALGNFHCGIFPVRFLLGDSLLPVQAHHYNQQQTERQLLHGMPPFLKIIIEYNPPLDVTAPFFIDVVVHADRKRHVVHAVAGAEPVFL